MSVLTLGGSPINWANPPEATAKVMWSQRTTNGEPVIGSLRTIAHLDHLSTLALAKYHVGVSVIQPPYNTGVESSEGTHDFDACLDVRITGVPWEEQQRFFRANGCGAYYRRPPAFSDHIHYFTLPPRAGGSVIDDFRQGGFKVGKYVDGGFSLFGKQVATAQIVDYYNHRTALEGHDRDDSWFPPNIADTIFNLAAYIKRQQPKAPKPVRISLINIPKKIGPDSILVAFQRALARGSIVGVNESFGTQQRNIYAAEAKKRGYSFYGLRTTPNVVFWKSKDFRRKRAKVHTLHRANTTAPNHSKWPGFYDKRELTEVVLVNRATKQEHAVLLTHLLYPAKVLEAKWVTESKDESLRKIRNLIRKHVRAGRIVTLMGDMNDRHNLFLPRSVHWYTPEGEIDKVAGNCSGEATEFPAPIDHDGGVSVVIKP